jgi:hypothetical protein
MKLLTGGSICACQQEYVEMRDAIVHTYRDQPHKKLLASDCLKHVMGDAGTIFRVSLPPVIPVHLSLHKTTHFASN